MKITFRACTNRGGSDHKHDFFSEHGRHYKYEEGRGITRADGFDCFLSGPARWVCGKVAPGRMLGLGLTGDYRMYLEFEDAEMENWLKNYIDTKPQEALELIAKMLPLVGEKLKAKSE